MNQSRDEGPPASPAIRRSWRGQAALDTPVVRHRWQRDWTALPAQRGRFRQHWQRLRMLLLLSTFAGLFALLTYLLLQSPIQTPVIAVVATQYDAPWPINRYGAEDLRALASLHRKSLKLVDASAEWSSKAQAIESLQRHRERLSEDAASSRALIVYISAIGAVNDSNQPCLILPGADPLDATTWLPMKEVLEAIQAPEGQSRPTLIVLDCVRDTTLLAAGIVQNTFVDRLGELHQQGTAGKAAILVANQTGDQAWTSSTLGQSVFGYFLHRGLAGEADYIASGGDGNRRVTIQELYRYLHAHVDAWATQKRAARQRPVLFAGRENFDVAWVTRNGHSRSTPLEPAISDEKLTALWRQRDSLVPLGLNRVDPIAWRRLEGQLRRLEEMAQAGEAYTVPALRSYEQLRKQFESLSRDRDRLQRQGSDIAWRSALTGEPWFPASDQRMHSLPLMRAFATGDVVGVNEASAQLEGLIQNLNVEQVNQVLAATAKPPLANTSEIRSLQLFQQYIPASAYSVIPSVLSGRILAEKAAVSHDIRALAWLKPSLAAVDQRRREAEDALFAGDVATARIQSEAVVKDYEAVQSTKDAIGEAFAICDQACAELPAWCLWIGRPRAAAQADVEGEDLAAELASLVDETRLLAAQLAEPSSQSDNLPRIAAIQQVAARVQKGLKSLAAASVAQQAKVVNESDPKRWPACVAEIEYLLALPSLSAEQRQALISRHTQLVIDLERRSLALDAVARSKQPSQDKSVGNLARHPLRMLATLMAASPGTSAKAADDVRALRVAWQQIAQQAATGNDVALAHEYEARLAIAADVPLQHDIPSALRRADWQAAWIWYAQRGLDDFLGPSQPGEQPLFAALARDYVQLARASRPDITAATQAHLEETTSLLAERERAASDGVQLDARNSLVLFNEQGSRTAIEVAAHDQAALPPGRLALAIRTPAGEPVNAEIQAAATGAELFGVATPLPAEPVRLEVLGQKLSGSEALLRVVAHQRGNAFEAPLIIRAAAGPTVLVKPTLVRQSTVVLDGAARKRPAIIFVLDCSKSMDTQVTVEATDARTVSKLEAAKNALQTMLNQLARQEGALVGVKFVGHRIGWTTREPLSLSRQTNYGRPIPEQVSPHNDVESVLSLGRFDALAAGEVSALMKTVVPWGQSPLYLGVIEALNELAQVDSDVDANVIVITDGLNYQFLPSTTEVVPADSTQTVDDVVRAAEGKSVRVHVVGFGVDRSEAAAAEEQFTRIAKATQGSYQPLSDVSRIIPHLESLLGPSVWELTALDGNVTSRRGARPTELGQVTTVEVVPGEANRFDASFRNAFETLTLFGGEAIDLRVSGNGQRLDVQPYAGNSPVLSRLVTGDRKLDSGYLIAVDKPMRTLEGLQLGVSLRHKDDQFVARPAEVWIEATPRAADGTTLGPTHVFYDPVFVNDVSSPLVRWNPLQWPEKAEAVEMRCWMQPFPVEPAFSDAVTRLAAQRSPMTDPAISGHSWLVEVETPRAGQKTFEVRVATWDRGAAQAFPNLKVGVRSKVVGVAAHSIEHVFDAENRVTTHRFAFSKDEVTPDDLLLELTPRSAITNDAWRTGEPVIVHIDSGLGLLSPAQRTP